MSGVRDAGTIGAAVERLFFTEVLGDELAQHFARLRRRVGYGGRKGRRAARRLRRLIDWAFDNNRMRVTSRPGQNTSAMVYVDEASGYDADVFPLGHE